MKQKKMKENSQLQSLDRRRNDNIKIDLGCEGVARIHLAQDRDHR
jgi:hypothetical protein